VTGPAPAPGPGVRTDIDAIADDLLAAYRTRTTIPPLTSTYPGLTVDQAYGIQQRQTELRIGSGASIAGFKVGLTSAAMRQQLGVDQPDFGHLFADMAYAADTPIPAGAFLQPRAEPEIALVLGTALRGPGLSVADILSATAYALPAIEIIDSRITDWRITLEDTIADNASSGGFVVGGAPTPLARLDLSLLGCVLRRNGRIEQTGAGAAVMGSPLHAATWLANTLTARGAELTAGHIILTGSITAAIAVAAGDTITVAVDQLGSVTAVFD
jgi:2-keto-4-pentenoate hydratase